MVVQSSRKCLGFFGLRKFLQDRKMAKTEPSNEETLPSQPDTFKSMFVVSFPKDI